MENFLFQFLRYSFFKFLYHRKPTYILVQSNNGYLRYSYICMDLRCTLPIPVTALSKAWFSGLSHPGIVGSNPIDGMEVCFL